jgi:import inner membrane translocase subunit TIM13
MSWFGFGGSKKPEDKPTSTSYESTTSFDNNSFSSSNDFSAPSSSASTNFAAPAAPAAGLGSGSFEQEVMMEQQKALIQAVMFKLTDAAFEACVTKPSNSLSSSEQSCISAVVGKYLETTELVVGRFQGQK